MPSDDYASLISGGLKLKGSKPVGITKGKKKKAKSKGKSEEANEARKDEDVDVDADAESSKNTALRKALEDEDAKGEDGEEEMKKLRELESRGHDGKTASERQYEEMRRKRLQDRLLREGVKTHKQRVEQLNTYLSNLSEHHDMPRIGPG